MNHLERKILRYIEKNRGKDNTIRLLPDYPTQIHRTKDEVIKALSNLQTLGYIEYHFMGSNPHFTTSAEVTLLKEGLVYRPKERQKFFSGTWDFVKFIIPVIMSALSLILSFLALLRTW